MCALSSELVTFLFERSGLNIIHVFKIEKNPQQPQLKKKSLKTDLLIKMCVFKKKKV